MKIYSLALATLVAASPAYSQSMPFTHEGSALTFVFNGQMGNGGSTPKDDNTSVLNLTSRYSLGSNFGLQFSLGHNSETSSGGFYGSRTYLDVNPYYSIGDGEIGLFFTSITGDGSSDDGTQIGVTGRQDFGDFTFEAYASRYDDGGFDITPVGIAVGYEINDAIDVYALHRRDGYSNGNYNALTTIGAGYDFGGNGVPLSLDIEYSVFHGDTTSIGNSDWNLLSLVVTYEFGNNAQTSMFNGVRNQDFFYD